jgi:hypothetical protein
MDPKEIIAIDLSRPKKIQNFSDMEDLVLIIVKKRIISTIAVSMVN